MFTIIKHVNISNFLDCFKVVSSIQHLSKVHTLHWIVRFYSVTLLPFFLHAYPFSQNS